MINISITHIKNAHNILLPKMVQLAGPENELMNDICPINKLVGALRIQCFNTEVLSPLPPPAYAHMTYLYI